MSHSPPLLSSLMPDQLQEKRWGRWRKRTSTRESTNREEDRRRRRVVWRFCPSWGEEKKVLTFWQKGLLTWRFALHLYLCLYLHFQLARISMTQMGHMRHEFIVHPSSSSSQICLWGSYISFLSLWILFSWLNVFSFMSWRPWKALAWSMVSSLEHPSWTFRFLLRLLLLLLLLISS